jgi:hypothetical protein
MRFVLVSVSKATWCIRLVMALMSMAISMSWLLTAKESKKTKVKNVLEYFGHPRMFWGSAIT